MEGEGADLHVLRLQTRKCFFLSICAAVGELRGAGECESYMFLRGGTGMGRSRPNRAVAPPAGL